MPFEDLDDDEEEEGQGAGSEALDDLASTVSSSSSSSPTAQEDVASDKDQEDDVDQEEESERSTQDFDPKSDPAFPTAKNRTQHSVYCLPDTWEAIDGSSGLLFEAEVNLRRNGYANVQKRELHNALLAAAANQLTAEDLAEVFIEARVSGEHEIDIDKN